MVNRLVKIRVAILVFLTHKVALPLLKLFRKSHTFPFKMEELKNFPPGSLGNDLFIYLEKRNFRLLKHYARHDLKHVLLDYDTTDEGEASLQSFMLGNGRVSFPVLATVLYSFVTMPEYWKKMRIAFQKGKKCPPIHNWQWSEILYEKTSELRDKIFIGF